MGAQMYYFDVLIHARPASAVSGDPVELRGERMTALKITTENTGTSFPVSFEEAAKALSRLPRMFIEPDGSFVWVDDTGDARWQVDGVLYDRDARLLYVELRGCCPPERFDDLLRSFGWPATWLVFQLRHEAMFLGEDDFRQVATVNR